MRLFKDKGMTIFAGIDHAVGASKVKGLAAFVAEALR
jgi:hypothetical protein